MTEYLTEFPLLIGILAAIIHVLSGPDHLAAVGPIAISEKSNSWLIGLFWGVGHIIGMVLIGILFFYFRDLIPVDFISAQSEKIVGLILIIIGIWVFFKLTKQKNKTEEHSHIHLHQDEQGASFAHFHVHQHNSDTAHNHTHPKRQGILTATGIGTIHGFAGVSHLLGLLPTLAFSHQSEAVVYLIGFAVGTILAMVLFSIILGFIGKKTSDKNKQLSYNVINVIAASIAVFVGLFWIYQSW